MQIAAIESVAAPQKTNTVGRESPPVSAFEELLRVAQSAGDGRRSRYNGNNVAFDGPAAAVPADARADRLSSMKADDRASRSPTGSRIAGSELSPETSGSSAENPRTAVNDRDASGDRTTQSESRSRDTGDANKSQQLSPPTIEKSAPAQPASTDQRTPVKAESPPKADGDPWGQSAGAQSAEPSAASAVATEVPPSAARIQATQSPTSTASAERVVGARSAAQLRDATPSRVRPGPAARPAREVVPKRPEQRAAIDRIVRTIQAGVRGKEMVARIELDPPALGHVRVRMNLKDDVLQVRVAAETDNARRILTSQIDELRSALEQQGVKVQKLAFHGPSEGDSPAGNRQDFGNANSGAFGGDAGQASTTPSDGGRQRRDRNGAARQKSPEPRASARAVSESAGSITEHAGELRVDIRI